MLVGLSQSDSIWGLLFLFHRMVELRVVYDLFQKGGLIQRAVGM